MPVFRWSELPQGAIDGEQSPARGATFSGEKIAVARYVQPAGTAVRPHARPCEQVHAIVRGRARYRVGGEERVVGPGDAVLVRAGTEYAAQVLDDLEVIAFRDVRPAPAEGPEAADGRSFFTWQDMKSDFITPKYSSAHGATITGRRIEVGIFSYPAGTEGKPHAHPNEQIQVPLAGKARGMIAGEEAVIGPGDGILFPARVEHGAKIVEDYTTINCKDIVPGWSVYHARWER
jgi:quercetin dioxygenase-like cupin family protein